MTVRLHVPVFGKDLRFTASRIRFYLIDGTGVPSLAPKGKSTCCKSHNAAAEPVILSCTDCDVYLLQVGYIDDPRGPIGLAGIVVLALTAILILEVMDFVTALKARP